MKLAWRLAVVAALAACTPSQREGDGTAPPPNGSTPPPAANEGPSNNAAETDSARIARLEREARALAKADGCSAGQCRTAPVGDRPCGGPREYIVYCAATTDSAALFAKLEELAEAEREYNQKQGLASTCEYRMPPQTELSGGTCRARPAQPSAEMPQ